MWLALSGERLKGGDVCAAGVATHFSESAVVDVVKNSVCDGGLELLDAMDWDADGSFEKNMDVIGRCFWKESVEDIFLALEGETGDWAKAQLANLRTKSPQTLKVAHRQLRRGLDLKTFEDNMRMEYRIASRVVSRHDFQEGVRAVIVDKDNKPQWDPPALAGVTGQMLDDIFAPIEGGELTFD
jgi:enoyl-CoA hydratase